MKYAIGFVIAAIGFIMPMQAQNVLTPQELLGLKYVYGAQISPDGSHLIYNLSIPRGANEKAGGAHSKTYLMDMKSKEASLLFEEEVHAYSPQWSPDGKTIAFLYKGEDKTTQVYSMSADGGEMKQISHFDGSISSFKLNPNGLGVAFTSKEVASDREKELKKRGYGFITFEENIKNTNLFVGNFNEDGVVKQFTQLTDGVQVWSFEFNKQGTAIAAGISPQNLVDHKYMFTKVHVIDLASKEVKEVSQNEGKLGNYSFSPDGKSLAYAAALNINDHQISQAFVVNIADGKLTNYTPENFKGHISWVDWKSDGQLIYHANEGVNSNLYSVNIKDSKRKVLIDGKTEGVVFQKPVFDKKHKNYIFGGSTPQDRINLYVWKGKGSLTRLTNINPELEGKVLGEQKVIRFSARDGLEIEGILILPINHDPDLEYPLIVFVHGGPESHHSNGFLSSYATPGNVMAGKGYMVAYFNYRASTGYGVDFAMKGLGDPAGKEFDDIADGMEYLIKNYNADRNRIGLAGGSYGGYAAAWFSTYYTQYVRAVGMFVGISDLISKRGTTDIPYEEMYVHSGKSLEEQWLMNLERSPIYWAHQSKTATLIYGGADDTRVHPSQSMELFRRMKVNNHPAVRLVQYPGEGHGNRKQVGQIDVLQRQMAWFDWYVRDLMPLEGEMPPLDISDSYGLDWEF